MMRFVLGVGLSKQLSVYLEEHLARKQIKLICASTLESGLAELGARPYQLVVADLDQIPDVGRVATPTNRVQALWRLILCNWEKWMTMVQLLDSGVDVCLPNNSPPSVIESQITALLRRTADVTPVTDPNRFMRGEIEIIPRYHQVKVRGEAVNLCRKEFKLLLLLAGSPGTVFSIAEISRYLWAQENTFSRTHTIESMISTLRRKLEADPRHPVYILTTRGVGYHFVSNYEELRRFFGE